MPKLELLATLSGHKDRVWNVAWSPDGKMLSSCGADKTIRIWSTEGENWVCKTILTDGHQRTVRSLAWAPDGMLLASTSFDATTCIWDRRSGEFECIATLEGHENEVKSASWSSSGSLLATCSRDKSVWIWEVDDDREFECASVQTSHLQDVKKVVWHPEKEVLASASYDNTIKLYSEDIDDWICSNTLTSHESTVWSISFDKTGQRLASCSDDRTVKIWQEFPNDNPEGIKTVNGHSTWKCVCTLSGYHSRTIYDICWCKLTGAIATACGDDAIRIFRESMENSSDSEPLFELVASVSKAHGQDVNCVAWNMHQTGLLASCSDDGFVKLWQYLESD